LSLCTSGEGFADRRFWWITLISERWLRHTNRLPADVRRREWILGYSAIGCAIIGGLGLLFLAIFDCYDYSRVHWSMTCVFIVFTALSAICQTGEVWSLYKDHPQRMSLLRSSIFKLLVVLSAVLGAVAFAILYGIVSHLVIDQADISAAARASPEARIPPTRATTSPLAPQRWNGRSRSF
jgi:hypothetical protein